MKNKDIHGTNIMIQVTIDTKVIYNRFDETRV